MTKREVRLWINALLHVYCNEDLEGEAFMNEWAFLLIEFRDGMPIQRKPY